MDIKTLKEQIINKTFDDSCIIFNDKNNNFVAFQYIEEIAKIKGLAIRVVEEIPKRNTLFNSIIEEIYVLHKETLDDISIIDINKSKNMYIIVDKINKSKLSKELEEKIVTIEPLEKWQLLDYIESILPELSEKDCIYLRDVCNCDIFRINNEIDKIRIFEPNMRNFIFRQLLEDEAFSDLTAFSIFDFTNAIIDNDKNKLIDIYNHIDNIDINEIGLISILTKNLINICKIQMTRNATPQTCGLSEKQFYAVKHSCGKLSNARLVYMLEFLTSLDKQIKLGQIDIKYLRDFLVIKLLGDIV